MEFAATVTKSQADAARSVQLKAREHIRQHNDARHDPRAADRAQHRAEDRDLRQHELEEFRVRVMRLTCTAGVSGLPQMSIPAGTINGCPVGLSFIGWAGGDEALLDLACELARHCGMAA